MIAASNHYDIVVIGSGPAGQNAAVEAGRRGARVLIIEREKRVGGACVQYGTIPSKTLRETAVTLTAFRRRSGGVYNITRDSQLSIASLMTRLDQVVNAHQDSAECCLEMANVERAYGRGSFVDANEIKIETVSGESWTVRADRIVVATGSRPRSTPHIAVDHENILDSDSILSMSYLPQSLAVLGSGVIACEYASTFAALGVDVIIVDKWPGPLGFLDSNLVDVFLHHFASNGGRFRGESNVESVTWDGVRSVEVKLESGEVIRTDKALAAMGRIANLDSLKIENAGIRVSDRGLLDVNEFCQTAVPHIYGVGDTIGPPALASTSMEQGRRAICHALNETQSTSANLIPTGIYTIPEMAMIGLTEQQAIEKHGSAIVGRVSFDRLARAHIMASHSGLLQLVADGRGKRLLGIQIVGDSAAELIHPGQMAMVGNLPVDTFASTIFNFPTMAEAYRLAALEIIHQRSRRFDLLSNRRVIWDEVEETNPI